MNATHLRVDYLKEPLGLGNPAPRFYWHCDGGKKQTAWQIIAQVGSETVWNSGKVESSSMTHIPYGGRPLKSRERVYWSIKLWDEEGNGGEIVSSWFEMGLLEKSDWQAEWITGNYKPDPKQRHPVDYFRKQFPVEKQIKTARLYASARGIYDVTINGQRIEEFILAPGMTDYRKRIQYQTYDVTGLLCAQNTVQLRLADGWYRGSCAAYGVTNVYGTQTSVVAQLEIIYADGAQQTICTDASWVWSNDGPIRFADLKDGEVYNAQMTPSFSGEAVVVDAPAAPLVAADNVPVREKERFAPKLLVAADGTRVMDFGQNIAGYLEFSAQGAPGEAFRLLCGEILDSDGHVDMHGIQEIVPAKRHDQMAMTLKLMTGKAIGEQDVSPKQEILFTCSGKEDHYKTSFAVFGFRYVQIDGGVAIDPEKICSIAVYSDMEQTGDFYCSNELVNKLVQNTRWSMKGNYLDLPTDCPTRERLGWTGDAQIFFDTGAYLMDTSAFFRKWLVDMEDAQYNDGVIPAVLPYQGVEMMYKATGSSVGWADAVYLIPYRYYKRFGDKVLLERCYPMMKKYSDYLFSHLGMADKKAAQNNPYNAYTYEKGVHLGEWLEPAEFRENISAGSMPKHPEEATAYLHLTMTTMAEIAKILDKKSDQAQFEKYAYGSAMAYDHLFVKPEMLDTDRQAKLVRPLALGLLSGAKRKLAQERLVKAVKNRNYHVGTGFLSTPFLLSTLSEAGEAETAYRMLENTEKPGWLAEILDNATTVWETWEGDVSQNHYSPGAVCQWLFDSAAGIRLVGENHFMIVPNPGGSLTHANAIYHSVYGAVESGWKKADTNYVFTVKVPANTTADLILPNGNTCALTAGTHVFTI